MPTIAVIGVDGAGKTTVTRMLLESSAFRCKYVYMGINIEASNHALPTTRLAAYLKRLGNKKAQDQNTGRYVPTPQDGRQIKRTPVDKLRAVARLTNRLAEEWYRQTVSWAYQLRGYIVLYDRHFVFDFFLDTVEASDQPLDKRLHSWFLAHLYPRPDLTIFLDAPAEVLFARKGEWDVPYLEARRQAMLRQGAKMPDFVQVDATQPLDAVYAEVLHHIISYLEHHQGSTPTTVGPSLFSGE